jgi:hypothetical protein
MTEQEKMRYWVENWKRVGPELERIKREELRALTDEQAASNAESILSTPVEQWLPERRRQWSGLVEQQQYFAQLQST